MPIMQSFNYKLAVNVAEIKMKIVPILTMKELGEDSLKEHQAIVNLIEKNKFTRVYLVGNEFALTDHLPYLSFSTIEEVSQHITKEKIENAVILIKGSRSMQMERIVDYI